MHRNGILIICLSAAVMNCLSAAPVKSLAGEWRVTGRELAGPVRLPGTLADAKLGRRMTSDDWKKDADRRSKGALTREWQYVGKAVYERTFELGDKEVGYPLELVLERVMGYSEIAIDGKTLGSRDSLATEHVYRIPQELTKAGRHTVRLTLDNSNRYGFSGWAHSYGPVMQSVWHGVVGEIALRRHSPLRQTRVFASWPANGKLRVEVPEPFKGCGSAKLRKCGKFPETGSGRAERESLPMSVSSVRPSPYRKGFDLVEFSLDREPDAWSEHHPNLYELTLCDPGTDFTHAIRFGFRSVSAHDRAMWINGLKWFMRGNLDCCHFPLTGAPDTSVEWWRETFRRFRREDGINTVRFHSWTPPKAAFDAADEMGMMISVEAGMWSDRWMKGCDLIGHGKPIDAFVRRELRSILEMRGNSPSFIVLGIGNELGGSDYKAMGKWLDTCKTFDPRRLYTASTARSISSADDVFVTASYPGIGGMRCRFNPGTDWDYEEVYAKTDLPTVAHEIGQWPIYVDWKHELAKYTGVMRPYNLEHCRDVAVRSGTGRFWPRFCKASANLNRLMYKDEVESFMRTPSCAGVQLLGVQDFTGQGEAMVGWRDSFYDLKPSVRDMPPFGDVYNPLAHLARFRKYVWRTGETYKATLVLRNVTEHPVREGAEFRYSCAEKCGMLRVMETVNPGEVGVIGDVELPLTADMAGKRHLLCFGANSWPFWVFNGGVADVCASADITETSSFDDAVAALSRGGKVLYTGRSARCSQSHFKPVYWSTGHFKNANADLSSLGFSVRASHPAFHAFPTEDWADWQWYHLVEGGVKHSVAMLPRELDPIVMPVPDLHYSTPMGMLFELKVGEGRLMVCGLNLSDRSGPEVGAMRDGIVSYMKSKDFAPAASMEMGQFKESFAPEAVKAKWRPPEFANATVYIAAAVDLEERMRNVPWKNAFDMAELAQGKYSVSGRGNWGVWRDDDGSFWHGQGLTVALTDVKPVNGTLWVRFRDTNRKNRKGRGTCEGRPFAIPEHQNNRDCAWWAKLPVMREDALDGRIELSCDALSGPNLMIDRIVLMEDR